MASKQKSQSAVCNSDIPQVVIVGGGLAGLSAAQTLSDATDRRCKITVLESKRITGGRASSFLDAASEESVDYCQHVAMGCCTNFITILKRFDLLKDWKRYGELVFHHPDHSPSKFSPSTWLPAPFHLAACIGQLGYLTRSQKREVRSGLWRLMRTPTSDLTDQTAEHWLHHVGQTDATIKAFWDVILVSALGEETSVVSMRAARKVLIDGFAAAQGASDVLVPSVPLSEMFGQRLPRRIESLGVDLRCQSAVKRIHLFPRKADSAAKTTASIELVSGELIAADQVIAAVPWHRLSSLFDPNEAHLAIPNIDELKKIGTSAITGIHLWLDRPIMTDDHAVMVGTTSQWLFRQSLATKKSIDSDSDQEHYHQVVISASGQSKRLGKTALLEAVLTELREEFPMAREVKLLRHRMVTDPKSVFSVSPTTESIRRNLRPALPWLHLAGDWCDTGWPATMESAVISGRMAAKSVLRQLSMKDDISIDSGLPWGRLAKLVIRR